MEILFLWFGFVFLFKQKTAYEMRISDWSQTCALPISLHAWIGGLLPPISDLYTSDSGASADTVATDARYVGGFVAALPGLLAAAGSGPVSGNLSADWCSSPPRFVGNQLWVTCIDRKSTRLNSSH